MRMPEVVRGRLLQFVTSKFIVHQQVIRVRVYNYNYSNDDFATIKSVLLDNSISRTQKHITISGTKVFGKLKVTSTTYHGV